MNPILKSIATKHGLYLGLILALQTVIAYAINVELFVNTLFGISIYILAVLVGIFAIYQTRKALNYVNFKETFTAYFLTILIGLAITTLVSFVLFNFIDTDAALLLKEKSVEKLIQVYKNINMAPEKIDEMVTQIKSENLFSLKNSLSSLAVNYLLPLMIIGLLISVVMKKSKPDTE